MGNKAHSMKGLNSPREESGSGVCGKDIVEGMLIAEAGGAVFLVPT
jgi:hypothetical protein